MATEFAFWLSLGTVWLTLTACGPDVAVGHKDMTQGTGGTAPNSDGEDPEDGDFRDTEQAEEEREEEQGEVPQPEEAEANGDEDAGRPGP